MHSAVAPGIYLLRVYSQTQEKYIVSLADESILLTALGGDSSSDVKVVDPPSLLLFLPEIIVDADLEYYD